MLIISVRTTWNVGHLQREGTEFADCKWNQNAYFFHSYIMLTSIYNESLLNFHLFNVKIVSFSQLNDFISFFLFPEYLSMPRANINMAAKFLCIEKEGGVTKIVLNHVYNRLNLNILDKPFRRDVQLVIISLIFHFSTKMNFLPIFST